MPSIPRELIGDLLTLDCNDLGASSLLVDRSGASRHAEASGTTAMTGAFGDACAISPAGAIFLPRDPDLGPRATGITIEAFVWLDVGGQVATRGLTQTTGAVTLAAGNPLRADDAIKIGQRCMATDELTVEVWVAPASTEQGGPARIVTSSNGPDTRNFTLGQDGELWIARVHSHGSDLNGKPMIGSAGAAPGSAQLAHLVLTVAGDQRRLYVDGRLRSAGLVPGNLGAWMADFPLLVGDEDGGNHPWEGNIHLLAIYERALDAAEVATNYAAGADPAE